MKKFVLIASLLVCGTATAHEVIHSDHDGKHTADDGHVAIVHDGHVDHLHDGHLHRTHDAHVDEHIIDVTTANPVAEEIVGNVSDEDHQHSADDDAHSRIQHGDHFDYIHNGRLHFVHGDHVDDHGSLNILGT